MHKVIVDPSESQDGVTVGYWCRSSNNLANCKIQLCPLGYIMPDVVNTPVGYLRHSALRDSKQTCYRSATLNRATSAQEMPNMGELNTARTYPEKSHHTIGQHGFSHFDEACDVAAADIVNVVRAGNSAMFKAAIMDATHYVLKVILKLSFTP